MAFVENPLSQQKLEQVAVQVGRKIGLMPDKLLRFWDPDHTDDLKSMGRIEVMESFPLWVLRDPVQGPMATPNWHHQIKFNKMPLAYARSKQQSNGMAVHGVFYSPLAMKTDRAIHVIDHYEELDDAWEARMLSIRTHLTHVFWLVNSITQAELILPIHMPEQYPLQKPPFQLFEAHRFLYGLLRMPGVKPIKHASNDFVRRVYGSR